MKRGFMILAIAFVTSAVFGETIFDTIGGTVKEEGIKKLKAQVEVIGADVNAASKDQQIKGYTPLTYAIDNPPTFDSADLEGQLRLDVAAYLLANRARNKFCVNGLFSS